MTQEAQTFVNQIVSLAREARVDAAQQALGEMIRERPEEVAQWYLMARLLGAGEQGWDARIESELAKLGAAPAQVFRKALAAMEEAIAEDAAARETPAQTRADCEPEADVAAEESLADAAESEVEEEPPAEMALIDAHSEALARASEATIESSDATMDVSGLAVENTDAAIKASGHAVDASSAAIEASEAAVKATGGVAAEETPVEAEASADAPPASAEAAPDVESAVSEEAESQAAIVLDEASEAGEGAIAEAAASVEEASEITEEAPVAEGEAAAHDAFPVADPVELQANSAPFDPQGAQLSRLRSALDGVARYRNQARAVGNLRQVLSRLSRSASPRQEDPRAARLRACLDGVARYRQGVAE
ncbi:hypothetical protein [Magnetofaba australis]|uniref:Putative Myristoylated alanine-rich C-kinase substrate n=1 Tax=Magnetofaba australis IT-1 TaxID=1434232 RepID=A0A1Y2K1H5_9PROT|nr:hypothetical protein [Magnetofaba australis]OSM01863.1 putative Myristoylated alanine-rich C-kinase substrate [Magnetofaba australis IT-1]